MDEVITCTCGSQSWVIGTMGTRCAKCGVWLRRKEVQADISAINARLQRQQNPVGYKPRRDFFHKEQR